MKFSDALRQIGKPIAYYRDLARPLGGATCSILFSQLFYWQDKAESPLGVYKTQEELQNETGLTRTELENARKKLRNLGILIETNKRLEHKIYYRLDLNKLDELMDKYTRIGEEAKPEIPSAENPSPRMQETRIGEEAKPAFVIDQEITTLDYNTRLHTNNPLPLTGQGQSADADMVSEATPANKKLSVDYDAIGDVFNQVTEGTPIPKIKVMSEQRKKLVLGIAKLLKKQFGDFAPSTFGEYFKDFIRQANQRRDKFYYGGSSTGWIADFDYIMKQKTFIKTFEDAL